MQRIEVNVLTGEHTVVNLTPDEIAAAEAMAAANPPPPPARLSKRVVVERLAKANLFDAAYAALGGPGKLLYERWSASNEVDPQDPDVVALLTTIGADFAVILRPGDEV